MSNWQRNTASGTYTLPIPQPVSVVKRIRVRLLSFEDAEKPVVYQWIFTSPVTSEAQSSNGDGGGSGCNSGFTIAGLALLLFVFKKR